MTLSSVEMQQYDLHVGRSHTGHTRHLTERSRPQPVELLPPIDDDAGDSYVLNVRYHPKEIARLLSEQSEEDASQEGRGKRKGGRSLGKTFPRGKSS